MNGQLSGATNEKRCRSSFFVVSILPIELMTENSKKILHFVEESVIID